MPTKDFEIWLNERTRIAVVFVTEAGHVVGFTVRLQMLVESKWCEIRRYDSAHGVAHVDVLNWRGKTVEKLWFPEFLYEEALTLAISDLKANYPTYIKRFLK